MPQFVGRLILTSLHKNRNFCKFVTLSNISYKILITFLQKMHFFFVRSSYKNCVVLFRPKFQKSSNYQQQQPQWPFTMHKLSQDPSKRVVTSKIFDGVVVVVVTRGDIVAVILVSVTSLPYKTGSRWSIPEPCVDGVVRLLETRGNALVAFSRRFPRKSRLLQWLVFFVSSTRSVHFLCINALLPYVLSTSFSTHPKPLT